MSLGLATKGYLGGDGSDRTVDVSGIARPNASVFIYLDGTLARTASADATGAFSATVKAGLGPHQVQARQVVASVVSLWSTVTRFSV